MRKDQVVRIENRSYLAGAANPLGKYNEERHKKIVDAIREGLPKGTSFRLAGLSEGLAYDWRKLARERPEDFPEYVQLFEDIELAQAEVEQEMVAKVVATGKSNAPNTWQAAAWWLERRVPKEYSRSDKLRVETPEDQGPLIQLNQVVLVDEGAREVSRDLLRRVASARTHEPLGLGMGDEPEETGSAPEE